MSGRNSLPTTLRSPILQRSGEGVTFRVADAENSTTQPAPASPRARAQSSGMTYQPQQAMNSPRSGTSFSQPDESSNVKVYEVQVQEVSHKSTPKTIGGYQFNLMAVVLLAVFFLVMYLFLYYSKLNMVTDLVNGERVLNHRKIVWWCVIFTAILAILLYIGYKTMY
tara:strand:- start:103550 stop:104050 length:501 start_codon:yes stop_codon:yes gene_type:complete